MNRFHCWKWNRVTAPLTVANSFFHSLWKSLHNYMCVFLSPPAFLSYPLRFWFLVKWAEVVFKQGLVIQHVCTHRMVHPSNQWSKLKKVKVFVCGWGVRIVFSCFFEHVESWFGCGLHLWLPACLCVCEQSDILPESSVVVMVTLGFRGHPGRTGSTIVITTVQLLSFHPVERRGSPRSVSLWQHKHEL